MSTKLTTPTRILPTKENGIAPKRRRLVLLWPEDADNRPAPLKSVESYYSNGMLFYPVEITITEDGQFRVGKNFIAGGNCFMIQEN